MKYHLFKLNPLIFRMRSVKVPEESIVSVLGQNGSNMKGIMKQSGSKINIKRKFDEILATVFISGGDED